MRVAPPEFVSELQRAFGSMYDVQWREHLGRWVVIGPTADGRLVEQTWGRFWEINDKGERVRVPVQDDGLPPFRDIVDREAQLEILASMEATYPFNRADGDRTFRDRFARITKFNTEHRRKAKQKRIANYLYALDQVDLNRPWQKFHQRPKGAVLVASASGVRRTPLFNHRNGKAAPTSS